MPLNAHYLELLKKALAKRQALKKSTNALRLVNGQGDGLEGLVLEQYDKHFVAQLFSPLWLKQSEALKDFLTEIFQVDFFIIKDRTQTAAADAKEIKSQTLVKNASSKTIVQENGLKFEVDLDDTLNTGLFLDMRKNRQLVGMACKNKRVLNCFSYTCSFGVYARAQGAKEVINVDISNKILQKGAINYGLNQFKSSSMEFIKADVLLFLERAVKKDNRFDVIILDPPSFARADKGVFSAQKDFPILIKLAVSVLNSEGKLFVSTNFSGINHVRLEEMVKQACQGKKIKKLVRLGQDIDFPGSGQVKESHLAALWVEFL